MIYNDEIINEKGIQLKKLLGNHYNIVRIKNSKDIADYMTTISKSLYPSNENTIMNIYKYSMNEDESMINDLSFNYKLVEEYITAVKNKLITECNTILNDLQNKKEKLEMIKYNKIENTIAAIKKNDKDTKIEIDTLVRINQLPSEIKNLVSEYAMTNDLKIILFKSKYDDMGVHNIMMKMNMKYLNNCLKQNVLNKKILYNKIHKLTNDRLNDLFEEYNFTRYNCIDYTNPKTVKIATFLKELDDMYNLICMLNTMMNNKYRKTQHYFKEYLLKCYHNCLYISNKSIENSITKRKNNKLQKQNKNNNKNNTISII